jgi:2-C-methyl-D-erythritol 2,4-cyclodiphosphate synthase
VGGEHTTLRVGLGLDGHRFAPERPLLLAGVRLRDRDGLAGHSDADVVCHAVIDALLGAAGLEDIGCLFPDTDPTYQGADSLELLGSVVRLLRERGWTPVNVDVVVICDEPRIAPHRAAMRARLAAVLRLAPDQVGVKGKTTEGLGLGGTGEGIAAQAVALVERVP